jgi:hypothetical protein
MKILQNLGLGLAAATNSTVNQALASFLGGTKLCGYFTGESFNMQEEMELE